jgi:hypothetical protein
MLGTLDVRSRIGRFRGRKCIATSPPLSYLRAKHDVGARFRWKAPTSWIGGEMERVARQVPANRRMEMAVHDKSRPRRRQRERAGSASITMRRRQPALSVKDHHEQTFQARYRP